MERLGEYTIVKKLGQGGFGTVYQAETRDKNVVALKVLNREMLDNDRVLQKFLDEAMILASIDHRHITKFIRLIKEGGYFAIVMEYVEGITLKDLMKQKPLPYEQAIVIAKQILEGFQFAHNKKVIHRDIKPANIMLDKNGDIKIMDFGIAKVSTTSSHGTSKWGTYHYSAPERFTGDAIVNEKTDIYSIGVMFYEMFTSRKPFESDDTARLIYCHVHEIPQPLTIYSKEISEQANQAILKALEKDPAKRFNNCAEFCTALDSSDTSTWTVTSTVISEDIFQKPKRWKKPLYASLAILLAMLISIGTYLKLRGSEKSELSPSNNTEVARLYAEKAVDFYNNNNSAEALKNAEAAMKLDSENVNALSIIGAIYYDEKNYEKALEFFRRAEKIKPEDEDIKAWIKQIEESK